MKHIKVCLFFGILVFTLALGMSFYYGDFYLEAGLIYELVWGRLMLLDLYIGFAIFALLISNLEKSWLMAVVWIVSLFCIGNLIALIYLLYRSHDIFRLQTQENV